MAIQDIKLGTQPSGAGGDTNRSANVKTNENFSNPLHAASRMVGTQDSDIPEYNKCFGGAYGTQVERYITTNTTNVPDEYKNLDSFPIGTRVLIAGGATSNTPFISPTGLFYVETKTMFSRVGGRMQKSWGYGASASEWSRYAGSDNVYGTWRYNLTSANTTTDSNGFIKKASPVIQLFATMIRPNAEAAEQNPSFEKVDIGHYLIKGTQGFATEGWWIEVPADTNGNKICAVQYQTLENGDLEVKTFKKKLNDEGDIVPNLDAPIDIPNNANGEPRWIDIRLNPLPAKPIIERVPRTEKQPKMVEQIKYAPQLTHITKMQDLIDDEGNPVIVKGQPFQTPVSYIHTDQNGTPILTSQPVINENGENVFELVQMVDLDGQPVFEDVPVLDADGNQIFDEVIHGPEQ
ncbi:phage tail fiber protein [Acinetobacter rudis]|uniref:Phage tail protein C-terminal domain-containing protein n=1 Tax=Acinetobacter rudis TaxID=632955 RepID=A0AAW8JAH7_9GAMM|nr:hypothetical protein [Acinetobacter rudis]MDQ8936653.1 hypothetical protein [Acinetobacter rudis]MDQ9018861.1 hypothetical protein [Acinetobacter rudis]